MTSRFADASDPSPGRSTGPLTATVEFRPLIVIVSLTSIVFAGLTDERRVRRDCAAVAYVERIGVDDHIAGAIRGALYIADDEIRAAAAERDMPGMNDQVSARSGGVARAQIGLASDVQAAKVQIHVAGAPVAAGDTEIPLVVSPLASAFEIVATRDNTRTAPADPFAKAKLFSDAPPEISSRSLSAASITTPGAFASPVDEAKTVD